MQRYIRTLLCMAMLIAFVWAQTPTPRKPASSTAKPAPGAKDEVRDRGMSMLQAAEADASALEGGMAAFALLQVARGYAKTDKHKAVELLEQAQAATRTVENDSHGGMGERARLQCYIMREMVNLSPGRVDELLPQVEPEARDKVLASLLSYYEAHKQIDRAIEVLYRISAEKEMPYDAASRLMAAMPPERHADVLQIFTTALASYRDHKEHEGDGEFPSLVITWKERLPPGTIREAIDAVLGQAEQDMKETGGTRGTFAMSSPSGSASFSSLYEFRLFQLLPILQELDAAAADKLLKQYSAVAAQLQRYPLGARSLQVPQSDISRRNDESGGASSPRWAIRGTPATLPARMAEFSRASNLVGDAEQHPGDALANIGSITDPNIRCYALEGIARVAYRKDRASAKSAVQKLVETIESTEGIDVQLMLLRSAVDLYLRMEDKESAKAALERGFALAAKAYRQDSNADEPNTALKAFWPSTTAYRWFCGQAAQLSPEWAVDMAGKLSDPELKVMAEIAMAHTMLKLPQSATVVISVHKDKVNMLSFDR